MRFRQEFSDQAVLISARMWIRTWLKVDTTGDGGTPRVQQ
jgi:hypothetical protein